MARGSIFPSGGCSHFHVQNRRRRPVVDCLARHRDHTGFRGGVKPLIQVSRLVSIDAAYNPGTVCSVAGGRPHNGSQRALG